MTGVQTCALPIYDGRTMEEERDRIDRMVEASTDPNMQRYKKGGTPPLSDKQQNT